MKEIDAYMILQEVKELDDSMYAYSKDYNEALEMALSALKKQVPTQPTEKTKGIIKCASCGRTLCKPKYGKKSNYCATCGQAICWDGVNNNEI